MTKITPVAQRSQILIIHQALKIPMFLIPLKVKCRLTTLKAVSPALESLVWTLSPIFPLTTETIILPMTKVPIPHSDALSEPVTPFPVMIRVGIEREFFFMNDCREKAEFFEDCTVFCEF